MRRRTSLELAIVLDESGSRTTKAAFPRKKLRVCRTGRLPIAVERAIALDGSRSLPDRRYEARSQGNRCSAHRFTCVSAHRIRCSPLRLVLGCQNRCFYACPKAALHYSRSIESGSEARTGLSAPIFPVWYRFFRFCADFEAYLRLKVENRMRFRSVLGASKSGYSVSPDGRYIT